MSQTAWANALIGRIFWDFLREKHWANVVSHKIQKKLSRIRVRAVSLNIYWYIDNVSYRLRTTIWYILAAALLYEWADSDWVGHGLLHAPNQHYLQTRGQPQRWVQIGDQTLQKSEMRWVEDDLLLMWLQPSTAEHQIRCCYPVVISQNRRAITPWPSTFRAYWLWCVRILKPGNLADNTWRRGI